MRIELARKIAEVCECELREDYSGRGMGGKETAGVIGDLTVVLALVIENADEFVDHSGDALFEYMDVLRTDSMDVGTIIY